MRCCKCERGRGHQELRARQAPLLHGSGDAFIILPTDIILMFSERCTPDANINTRQTSAVVLAFFGQPVQILSCIENLRAADIYCLWS